MSSAGSPRIFIIWSASCLGMASFLLLLGKSLSNSSAPVLGRQPVFCSTSLFVCDSLRCGACGTFCYGISFNLTCPCPFCIAAGSPRWPSTPQQDPLCPRASRGHHRPDVADAVPAVPRLRGGPHGGGAPRHCFHRVRERHACHHGHAGVAGVQDHTQQCHAGQLCQAVAAFEAFEIGWGCWLGLGDGGWCRSGCEWVWVGELVKVSRW